MRSVVQVTALMLMLVAMLLPLTSHASGGKCPDDLELSKNCDQKAPPFYVVINRDFEALDRPGTGCQPIILKNPECTDCCGQDEDCRASVIQIEDEVCPMLADGYDWNGENNVILYEMCCDCGTPNGEWMYRVRLLYPDGSCPYDVEQNPDCYPGLPPGTGIDLPAPLIAAGLAVIGAAMLGVGMVVRRRTSAPLA